jgi:tripartite-type tricarboxylate transporter receptor subunit TctC
MRSMAFDRRKFMAGFAALTAPTSAARAAGWPDRPITVIVPYAAGATGTVVMQLLAEQMGARLGQPIVVEPSPGAGGNIGAGIVASAAPNGYTVLVGATNNFVINQYLFANMKFDPLAAFEPVTRLVDGPLIFFCHPSLPAKTLPEFVAYARANPGKLNFASPGIGTSPHLASERLKQIAGIDMAHVPFTGSPPAMQALLSNQVQLYLAAYAVAAGHLASGAVSALASVTPARIRQMPDLPTAIESGYPGFTASNWWGMAAPKGTPADIIARLRDAAAEAMKSPKVLERFEQLGIEPVGDTPEHFVADLVAEASVWRDTVEKAGLAAKQ